MLKYSPLGIAKAIGTVTLIAVATAFILLTISIPFGIVLVNDAEERGLATHNVVTDHGYVRYVNNCSAGKYNLSCDVYTDKYTLKDYEVGIDGSTISIKPKDKISSKIVYYKHGSIYFKCVNDVCTKTGTRICYFQFGC